MIKKLICGVLFLLLVSFSESNGQMLQKDTRIPLGKNAYILLEDDTIANITRSFLVRKNRHTQLVPYHTEQVVDFYWVPELYKHTFLVQYGQLHTTAIQSGCVNEIRQREVSHYGLYLRRDGSLLQQWSPATFIYVTTADDGNARKPIIAYLNEIDRNKLCIIYPTPDHYRLPAVISLQDNETWQQLKAVWQTDKTYDLSAHFRFQYHYDNNLVDILLEQQLVGSLELGRTPKIVR